MKKNSQFKWNQEAQQAFETLKTCLTEAPILIRPDLKKRFILYTDASKKGLGAILAQEGEDKLDHVIVYTSKATNKQQENYRSTKLECLAVVWALSHYRQYLFDGTFTLVTDHSALKWLFKKEEPSGIFA